MKRFEAGNIDEVSGVQHKVEIYDAEFSGSSAVIDNTGTGWLTFSHQKLNPRNPFENPIQKGELKFSVYIDSAADETFLNDVIDADESRFTVHYIINSETVWKGNLISDLTTFAEDDYENEPYPAEFVAKDLSLLEGLDYNATENRVTWITTFSEILDNLGYDLDIYTATSWSESTITESDDYLRQIYHDQYALQNFGANDQTQTISVFDALLMCCRNNKLFLKQWKGWRLDQLTSYEDPTSVVYSEYTSDGSLTSQTTADRSTSKKVTVNSQNQVTPAYKRINAEFDHRTIVQFINFEGQFPSITLSGANAETKTANQLLITDGTQSLELRGTAKATGLNGSTDMRVRVAIFIDPSAGGDDYYWDGEGTSGSVGWVNNGTAYYNNIPLQQDGDVAYRTFSIVTEDLPDAADGTLNIFFDYAISQDLSPNLPADTTEYYGLEFEIKNPSVEDGNNEAIRYRLTQVDSRSTNLDLGSYWYGDGPTSYSMARLSTDSDGLSATADTWGRRDGNFGQGYFENLLKEVMDFHRKPRRALSGVLNDRYDPSKIIQYRDRNYFYIGGSIDGSSGAWFPDLLQINVELDVIFDDSLFYVLDDQGTDAKYIKKGTVTVADEITISETYQLPTDSEESGINDVIETTNGIYVLGNGNVVFHAAGDGDEWQGVWLFDGDLNLINFLRLNMTASGTYGGRHRIFIDEDDNIYIPDFDNTLRVKKYNSQLSEMLWESDDFATTFWRFVGGNVCKNFVAIASNRLTESTVIRLLDKDDGSTISSFTDTDDFYDQTTANSFQFRNFTDGKIFVVGDQNPTNGFRLYDEDFNEEYTVLRASIPGGLEYTADGHCFGANADGTIIIAGSNDTISHLDPSGGSLSLIWNSNSLSERPAKLGWTTDPNRLVLHRRLASNNTGNIREILLDSEEINNMAGYTDNSIAPGGYGGFGMKVENWQLRVDRSGIIYEVRQ